MVNFAFMATATGMVVAATAALVFPMLRKGRDSGRSHGAFGWVMAIAALLPLGALGLDFLLGTPAALDRSAYAAPTEVDTTLAQLRAEALKQPDALAPWLLLGRAAATMQQSDTALEAFGHALKVAPDDADVMVAYAEAVAAKNNDHRLDPSTLALLERAVSINPRHQHGLLLLGIADYQNQRFADAATRWKQLLAVLPADSRIAAAIARQIADAESHLPGNPAAKPALPEGG
jgi:cytochrome c-type biogenesis protein CcmH